MEVGSSFQVVQLYFVTEDGKTLKVEELSFARYAINQGSDHATQELQPLNRDVNPIVLEEKTSNEEYSKPEQKEREEAKPSAPKPEKNPQENEKPAAGKDSEPKQKPASEGKEHQRADGRHSEGKSHGKGHLQTHNNNPADNSHHLPSQNSNQTGQPEQKSNECDQSKDSSEAKETDGKKIDENEGGEKDVKEIARQIAKELIPEKFNFLILTIPCKFHHSPLPKEEKEKTEPANQKNGANKSAAKGEGRNLEQGAVPEKLDPAQKVASSQPNHNANNPQQFPAQVNPGKMDRPGEFQIPKNFVAQMGQSQPHLNFGKQGEAPLPNNPAFNSGHLKNQEFFGKQSYQTPPFLQTNYREGGGMQNQSQQLNPTMTGQYQPLSAGRGQTPVFNGNNPIPPAPASDLSKVAKGAIPQGKIEEVGGAKQVQPRRDAIPGIDRNENQRLHKHRDGEEGMPVRFPVLPDLPQSGEGVLKDREGKNNLNIRVDEGYRLGDLLLMLLCGVICNGRNASEIAAYLQGREAFFKTWLGLKKGLPSPRLLGMLLNWLEPSLLEGLINLALGKKTSSLQNVMVWESDRGIIIGELKEHINKMNDSPLLEVMGHFDLKESLIAIHADTLRKDFSRQIRASDGDYIIALKSRHGNPYECVQEFFYDGIEEKLSAARHQRHQDHIEEKKLSMLREILVVEDVSWFVERDGWSGLKSTIQFNSQTTTEKTSIQETRYYLTSLPADGKLISQTLRTHSILESKADWYLDFDFTKSPVDHKYENFDLLRSFSWDLINSEGSAKIGAEAKRKKAQIDNSYLRLLLGAA